MPQGLVDAAAIIMVEVRHAGAVRDQYGLQPTLAPFDDGNSIQRVLAIVGPLPVT